MAATQMFPDGELLADLETAYEEEIPALPNGMLTSQQVARHSDAAAATIADRLRALAREGRCQSAMTLDLARRTETRGFAPADVEVSSDV